MIPIGIFQLDSPMVDTRPPWASFGMLMHDDPRLGEALRLSIATGFQWILWCSNVTLDGASNRAHFQALHGRLEAAGLLPYVIATICYEEWYRALYAGELPVKWNNTFEQLEMLRDWIGRQHADLRAVFGVPVVWLETFVNEDRTLGGPAWWRPVPPHTDVVAIEAYLPTGTTFAELQVYLDHALETTDKPLVLVEQAFRSPGDALWGHGPTVESLAGVRAWRQRAGDRLKARWLFTWAGVPPTIGLTDMPDWEAAVIQ